MITEFEMSLTIVCACIIIMSVITGTIVEIVLNHKLEERTRAVYYHKWHKLYTCLESILRDNNYTSSEKCSQIKGFLKYDY